MVNKQYIQSVLRRRRKEKMGGEILDRRRGARDEEKSSLFKQSE